MTRVIHTGDTHIGYRQYHSPERRRDFLAAFERVIEDAIDGDVDAVVHAGDLFHDRRPDLPDLQGTIAALRRLRDADVPFLAVVGNHESKRDAQWLDLFEDLGLATRLGDEPRVVGDVAFYGLDFVARSLRSDLAYEFAPHDAAHAALVSHGLFEPFAHADWDTERLLTEATVDFDAVLLGDNHAPGKRKEWGTWLTYCGSTERVSAEERDDRGYNIVTFDEAIPDGVEITRRGLDVTREFAFVDVDLAAGEGIDRVRERVRQHDCEDSVVIVTIEGDGGEVVPAAVEEAAIERGALVARVNDRRDRPDDEETAAVQFADPDAAVRERVQDLGLSAAAREIDETVRADDIVDANVRDRVESLVREQLDADLDAFAAGPDAPAGDSSDDATAESGPEDGPDTSTDDGGGETATDEARGETAGTSTGSNTDPPEENPPDDTRTGGEDGTPAAATEEGASETTAEDGQSSMEEFL